LANEQKTVLPKRLIAAGASQSPASGVDNGQALATDSFSVLNKSVQQLRAQDQIPEALRQLVSFDGTTSTGIFNFVEVAHSPYKIAAYDPITHAYSPEATRLANSFVARINSLSDYSKGYSDRVSFDGLIEMGLLELVTSGAICNELVLDKARLPESITTFSYDSITWKAKNGARYPVQQGSTGEVNLDFPTIFITESHRFASKARARSMMEPAINTSWYFNEFIEDMRRTVRSQGNSRLVVTLNAEKVVASAPEETKADPALLQTYLTNTRDEIQRVLSALNPEDALVMYDTAEADAVRMLGEKSDYVPLLQNISGTLATSLKTSPSILGLRMEGSQSLSNTESLIFLKLARALQRPVESNLSRILTLAVRLYGIDAYVELRFDAINLRPDDELEAFKVMRQTRIMELLSVGHLTDDEAALEFGVWQRPAGAPDLSGTMFTKTASIDASKASPNTDPQGAALQPDSPDAAGGASK
jgi:hypothetical protein